jgi:hypothetical protein
MIGIIEDGLHKGNFSLSLSENYLDYINDLKLVVQDITDKERKLDCSTYFLAGVDINNEYKIKLEAVGNSLMGYIESQEKLPEFIINEMGEKLKPVIINTDKHNQGLEAPNSLN